MPIDDSRPIWIQLVDDFRLRIVTGAWVPGTRIPSVRDLAADTGVNPNTVQRALAELDRSGLTTAERTAGRFVTADTGVGAADTFITAVTAIGMDLAQAGEVLTERWPDHPIQESGETS